MPKRIHFIASIITPLCLMVFFVSTILVELWGTPASVALVKSWIVNPGLWVMIPAMAAAGVSGVLLSKSRQGKLIERKKKRMPFIAVNGLLVLMPCAIVLNQWAAVGLFHTAFYLVQIIELLAGMANFTFIMLNMRDGLRMAGRQR